jgi:general secretion pathway protein G
MSTCRQTVIQPTRRARGFTLLELLVVMVILGLLAGYVGPKLFAQLGKSETRVAKAQIDALAKALDQYRLDMGRYPSTSQGLQALVQRPEGETRWAGPYLAKALPPDPWGRPYGYRLNSGAADGLGAAAADGQDYELWSDGPDGRSGSDDDRALRHR